MYGLMRWNSINLIWFDKKMQLTQKIYNEINLMKIQSAIQSKIQLNLCRNVVREFANDCLLPGVTKASW